jgi:hypothetical protein
VNKPEKKFDCDFCEDEFDYECYHTDVNGNELKQEDIPIHCKECNKPIPFHLLRGSYYQIFQDEALFKLLITGKGTGKSINLMILQV